MISVVIPLFNKAHTIVNTLKSVFAQTYQNFEVIIVDDGSTDNGVDVVKSNFNDSRIRIIQQKNSGVSVARNNGAYNAKSDWLTFLDADDEWQPGFLAEIIHLINNHPNVDFVGTGGYHKDAKTGKISPMVMNKYVDKEVVLNYFINPDKMPHLGATAIRKRIFEDVGGFPKNIKAGEDLWLLYKIGLQSKIAYSGKSLHVYVGNVEGQTTKVLNSPQDALMGQKISASIMSDIYEKCEKNGKGNKLVPEFIRYRIYHSYLCCFRRNDYESIKTLSDNLSYDLKKMIGILFVKLTYKRECRRLLMLYIFLKKMIWRMHGYPRVGEKIDKRKEIVEKYINISKYNEF